MAGDTRDLRFRFIGEDSSLGRALGGVQTKAAAVGSAFGNLAANGITAGLGAVKNFAAGSVDAFARVEDATGVAGVTFGQSAAIIEAFAATSAKNFGISAGAALDASNTFGSIGKSAGLSGADLAQFSTKFTGLAGDLASFKGSSPEEAITAIGAAMRGETEPIRAFGVSIDDAALRAEALKQGLIKTTKEALTPQQKALAASALIFKQTGDAQGDFQKTSDSTANTQKRLAAETENAQAALGEKLAPAVTKAREGFLTLITGLGTVIDDFKRLEPAVDLAAAALSPLVDLAGNTAFQALAIAIGTVTVAMNLSAIASGLGTVAMTAYVGVMSFAIGAVSAVTGAVTAMNIAMRANPIGAVVTVVLALGAALTFAYKNSETFRRVVDSAFAGVKVAAGNMVGAMVSGFRAILSVWLTVAGGIVSAAATALSWVPGVGPKLKQANAAFEAMKTGILGSLETVAGKAFGFGERTGKGVAAGATSTTRAAALAGGTIGNKVVDEVGARQGQARAAGSSLGRAAIGGVRTSADGAHAIGLDVGDGLARGIRAKQDAVVQAARALGAAAIGGVRRAAETFSPSRATIRVGQDIGDGLVIGMGQRVKAAVNGGLGLGSGVLSGLNLSLADIKAAQARALSTPIDQASLELNAAQVKAKAAMQASVRAMNAARGPAGRGMSEGARALRQAAIDAAKASVEAAKEAAAAQAKLADAVYADHVAKSRTFVETVKDQLTALANKAKELTSAFASSVTQGSGLADLFKVAEGATGVDLAGGLATLRGQVEDARAFAVTLGDAAGAGLSDTLVKQLAAMGPKAGGELARTLLAAGPEAIGELNNLTSALATVAETGMAGVVDTFYGEGARSIAALVSGMDANLPELKAQVAEVQSLMQTISTTRAAVSAASAAGAVQSVRGTGQSVTVVTQLNGREIAREVVGPVRESLAQTSNRNGGVSPVNR